MITLPTAEDITAIFDFKGIFETAMQNMFFAAGFQKGKNLNAITSTALPDFQVPTPRVDISVRVGEATMAGAAMVGNSNIRFYATYKGVVTFRAVTRATDKATHAQYRAQILFMGQILGYLLNNQSGGLCNHKIHDPTKLTGTSDVFQTDKGFEYSDANFAFDFSIIATALQQRLAALQVTQQQP